jgi:hypothetical protein
MADFSSGVKAYIIGECVVKIHFPVDFKDNPDVCCYQCRMFSRSAGVCRLTNEVSEYPARYIGSRCPLNFDGEIKEIRKEN